MSDEQIKQLDADYAKKMAFVDSADTEAAHMDADHVLVRLLLSVGFTETVAAYRKIEKWYA